MSKSRISIYIDELENNETVTISVSKGSKLEVSSTKQINTKLNKIMAKLEDFDAVFARHDAALEDLKADIDFIKANTVPAGGLTEAEETELAARFESATAKLEALALQNDSTVVDETPGDETPAEGEGPFGEDETPVTE